MFEQAKAILADAEAPPRRSDFEHLADLDERARRLLTAVQTAWVFGGMGSWNDTGPDEALAPEYERTSETLFRALEAAMPAIANSTYRG